MLFKINYWIVAGSFALFFSCGQKTAEQDTLNQLSEEVITNSLKIESENFTNSKGTVVIENLKNGQKIVSVNSADAWLEYDVNIVEPGRYKFELNASAADAESTAWMEDYVDNKDNRTYNITGSISLPISGNSGDFLVSGKDGSPLNKGVHKMRLHLPKENVKVDWFTFSLIKKHQFTPKTLTQNMDGKDWVLAWSDEFDKDGLPDTSLWTFDIGDWGWGNNELQYYTENRTENARIENGQLIIEARKNDMGRPWTSARLTTRGKVSFLYGRIEFKAKVPVERGNWAAGWTLGDKYIDELSWPYCGEIDILECVGYEIDDETGNGKAHASAHSGAYYFKLNNQPTGILDVPNMGGEFHVYAVDWAPEGMTATVDGQEYFKYDDTSTSLSWPFDQPQSLIINLAMGGGWGGKEGIDESVNTQKLIFDYVRVYERSK